MKTDKLLLDRWTGYALPEDYTAWAVELMMDGRDTPSLCVLAGLIPALERDDIEDYFLRSCNELNLRPLDPSDDPRDAAPLVRRLYQSGTLSPKETLRRMSSLYERSDYSDPLLSLWFGVEDEFFPEPMEFLEEWIDREWGLFDLASELDIPSEFYRFCRCESCRHIGLRPQAASLLEREVAVAFSHGYPADSRCRTWFVNLRDTHLAQEKVEHPVIPCWHQTRPSIQRALRSCRGRRISAFGRVIRAL